MFAQIRHIIIVAMVLPVACTGWTAVAQNAAGESGSLISMSWWGQDRILSEAKGTRWQTIWSLPSAAPVESLMATRMAQQAFQWLRPVLAQNASDQTPLLKPLCQDLIRSAAHLEARTAGAGADWVLAVQLKGKKADTWTANLGTVLAGWTGAKAGPCQRAGVSGTVWQPAGRTQRVEFLRLGDWAVLHVGPEASALRDEWLKKIQGAIPASTNWFAIKANWPALKTGNALHFPDWPRMELALAPKGEDVRWTGELLLARKTGLNLESWKMPTGMIHEPLISFTAARGVDEWVSSWSWVRQLNLKTIPSQYFIWALSDTPFNTYIAAPCTDAPKRLQELVPALVKRYNPILTLQNAGALKEATNHAGLLWQGLPIAVPNLTAVRMKNGQEFLSAGMFPNNRNTNALPAELLSQLRQPNLVYYDWEITQNRLMQWRGMGDLFEIMLHLPRISQNKECTEWMDAAGKELGNTGTEVTQVAPGRLSVVRNSPAGLTACEIYLLLDWLNDPERRVGSDTRKTPPKAKR